MKNIALSILISLLLFPFLQAEEEAKKEEKTDKAKDVGKIVRAKGAVTVLRKLKKIRLKLNDKVYIGDKIKTEPYALCTVAMHSGHKYFILSNSSIKINKSGVNEGESIDHNTGSVWFKVRKLKQEESFEVKTPSAVAGVRGTGFITTVMDDTNVTSVCVCEGSVEVESEGVRRMLKAGEGSKLMKGQVPGAKHSNKALIRRPRLLKKQQACIACHSGGYGSKGSFDSLEEHKTKPKEVKKGRRYNRPE